MLITRSAPSWRAYPTSGACTVQVTPAPSAVASWVTKEPTPPAPPCTSTRWPGCSAAWSTRASYAVSAGSTAAAATTCDTVRGRGATPVAGTLTYSAAAPSRSNGTSPYTSSPIDSPVTPSPTAATTPESSWDGMTGVRSTPPEAHVSGQVNSSNVMAAAWMATSTSPSPGACRGAGSYT